MITVPTTPHTPAVEGVWNAIFELHSHYQNQLTDQGETPEQKQVIQHQLKKLNAAIAHRRKLEGRRP